METLPAITPQLPATTAPAGATGAADPTAASDAAPEGEFQALLTRSLAGVARCAKGAGETPGAPVEEDGDSAADATRDEHPETTLTATDSTLALLAALPQAARSEARSGTAAAQHGDGAGVERAMGPRAAESILPGAKPVRAGESETALALSADAEKRAEHLARDAQQLPEFKPADPAQGAHAPLHASHVPAASQSAQATAAGPAAPRIDTPLGAPGWSTALADRVMMFVGDKQQVAELHINPPHLGPVEITLTVSNDQASAVFASPHAVVRETIESSLPRLREVLAESGINLGQASVTADSPRDGSGEPQSRSSYAGAGSGNRGGAETSIVGSTARAALRARSLVDLFA